LRESCRFSGYNQYQAYVADGYQFGPNSLQAGIDSGISFGGPLAIGGGLWAAGLTTFAAGTGIGGAAIGLGYLGYASYNYATDPSTAPFFEASMLRADGAYEYADQVEHDVTCRALAGATRLLLCHRDA
jgi:hypothetical protein